MKGNTSCMPGFQIANVCVQEENGQAQTIKSAQNNDSGKMHQTRPYNCSFHNLIGNTQASVYPYENTQTDWCTV